MNDAQKKLLAVLVPVIGVVCLAAFGAPMSRGPFVLILASVVVVVLYVEVLLFGLEDRLRSLGAKTLVGIVMGFVIVVGLTVASPYVRTTPGYWYPPPPEKPGKLESAWALAFPQNDSSFCTTDSELKTIRNYVRCTPELLAKNKSAIQAREEKKLERQQAYEQAVRDWERKRTFYPETKSLRFRHDVLGYGTAIPWLLLIIVLGVMLYRLLASPTKERI